MEIITKDSKLYFKYYRIWLGKGFSKIKRNSKIWRNGRRFTSWNEVKKCIPELLFAFGNGVLYKLRHGEPIPIKEVEEPEIRKGDNFAWEHYGFKSNEKWVRAREVTVLLDFIEITKTELNELKGVSL